MKLRRVITVKTSKGLRVYCEKTGEFLGTFTGSVGPYGTSSGIFARCKTTTPFDELYLTIIG